MASAALPLRRQLLLPLELSNSLRGSFAMTAAYLPGMLTCFHGIELPPLEGPGGSVLAKSLPGCSLSSATPLTIALAVPQGLEPAAPAPHLPWASSASISELLQTTPKWKPCLTPLTPLDLYPHVFLPLLESRFPYL